MRAERVLERLDNKVQGRGPSTQVSARTKFPPRCIIEYVRTTPAGLSGSVSAQRRYCIIPRMRAFFHGLQGLRAHPARAAEQAAETVHVPPVHFASCPMNACASYPQTYASAMISD